MKPLQNGRVRETRRTGQELTELTALVGGRLSGMCHHPSRGIVQSFNGRRSEVSRQTHYDASYRRHRRLSHRPRDGPHTVPLGFVPKPRKPPASAGLHVLCHRSPLCNSARSRD